MPDIRIRTDGKAGRITLDRAEALNAVTYEMCLGISKALEAWRDDDRVKLILIDAEGERAFSAGGDIRELYDTGISGNYGYGQKFWYDEYRMNADIAEYSKPIVSFLQGFTMGGGVGVGCHASHRIVGESSQIAMPECGIGLVPDVGGSNLLAGAPGHLGEFLGMTGTRMGPADAVFCGFADLYVPEDNWEHLKSALCVTGDVSVLDRARQDAPPSQRGDVEQADIDRVFSLPSAAAIRNALATSEMPYAARALKGIDAGSPISVSSALAMVRSARSNGTLREALKSEYRFTYRSMEHGDFLEGIRAQVIDKDREPAWRHDGLDTVRPEEVTAMLAPLGENELTFEDADTEGDKQ
jgi:enoyl-CoA hydratase